MQVEYGEWGSEAEGRTQYATNTYRTEYGQIHYNTPLPARNQYAKYTAYWGRTQYTSNTPSLLSGGRLPPFVWGLTVLVCFWHFSEGKYSTSMYKIAMHSLRKYRISSTDTLTYKEHGSWVQISYCWRRRCWQVCSYYSVDAKSLCMYTTTTIYANYLQHQNTHLPDTRLMNMILLLRIRIANKSALMMKHVYSIS